MDGSGPMPVGDARGWWGVEQELDQGDFLDTMKINEA